MQQSPRHLRREKALFLLARPEIDGVLVGGASLEADALAELVGPAARHEGVR